MNLILPIIKVDCKTSSHISIFNDIYLDIKFENTVLMLALRL